MKLMAWFDRHTPRDLYDLAAVAEAGHLDGTAVRLVRTIAGYTPRTALERKVPSSVESSWQAELGHQTRDLPSPDDCLNRVRHGLDRPSD